MLKKKKANAMNREVKLVSHTFYGISFHKPSE